MVKLGVRAKGVAKHLRGEALLSYRYDSCTYFCTELVQKELGKGKCVLTPCKSIKTPGEKRALAWKGALTPCFTVVHKALATYVLLSSRIRHRLSIREALVPKYPLMA